MVWPKTGAVSVSTPAGWGRADGEIDLQDQLDAEHSAAPHAGPDAASVVRRLRSEHPQIIAAVLVRLDSALAAQALGLFPDEMRNHIILRIATLKAIRPAAMRDLHEVLLFVLAAPHSSSQTAFGGVSAAGKIIDQLGSSMEAAVMASIRDHDPDLASAITTRLAAADRRRGPDHSTGGGADAMVVHNLAAGARRSGAAA